MLSLARALKTKSPSCNIVYIGLKGELLDRLRDEYLVFDEVYYISAGKFRRYHGESILQHLLDVKTLMLNLRDAFRVLIGIIQANRIIRRVKPTVVFSKGGFVAVPVGIVAKLKRIKIVTHDSDIVPGLANRIIGRWAAIHATGMPARYYSYPKDTIRYVGIPLNENILPVTPEDQANYKQELAISTDKKVVLVSGGGHGAMTLNSLVTAASPEIVKAEPDVYIIHLAGDKHVQQVEAGYAAAGLNQNHVKVMGFTNDFYKFTGAADLVITRAGATTLAELAAQGKACIVIPSPFLTGGHQLKNAEGLRKLKAVETLPNNATPSELSKLVNSLITNSHKRAELSANFASTAKPGAAGELADIILSLSAGSDK